MKKFNKIIALVMTTVLALSFASCAKSDKGDNTPQEEKKEITVSLDWTPNTNHTGMYVALANGYYADAGLDVKIVQPPEGDAIAACSSGQVQFAVGYQDLLAAGFVSDSPMEVMSMMRSLPWTS